jgi:hypothetical protein
MQGVQGRTALALAIASGAAAVTLVSLDLAWNLTAELETLEDGTWVRVASAGEEGFTDYRRDDFFAVPGCATPQLRVTAHNDAPFARTLDVRASYWQPRGGSDQTIFRETWRLDGFSQQTKEFTVPEAAYTPDTTDPGFYNASINVYVGDLYLSTCVEEAS